MITPSADLASLKNYNRSFQPVETSVIGQSRVNVKEQSL
jgi:hypothetical protein